MNNKIGFRVKIELDSSNLNLLEIEKIFLEFFGNYDLLELKLSNKLMTNIYFCDILNICNKTTDSGISFHLPSDMILGLEINQNYKNLLNNLKRITFNNNTRLITHCPKINDINFIIDATEKLCLNIPNNTVLLLENTDDTLDCLTYIKFLESVFIELNNRNCNNVLFCIDFGHLLFNALKSKIEAEEILKELELCKFLLNCIGEIHIHDFDFKNDHKKINDGYLNVNQLLEFLRKNNINAPIILEVTLNDVFKDGYKQIQLLK